MRVVFFVGTLQAGGLERFVTRVSLKATMQNQFTPVVVCLTKKTGIFLKELLAARIEVHEAPHRWFRSPVKWWQFVCLLRQLKPDVVHSQVNFSMLQQFFAAWVAGARFTVTERNCYQRSGMALVRRRLQYSILKIFGVYYSANSQRVATHLATMLRERPERFTILPNGIDVSEYDTQVTSQGTEGSLPRIIYVARMADHKGHLFFLDVLENLIYTRSLKCEAILIGDGPLRKKIEQVVDEKGLRSYTTLTGVVSNVDTYLELADVVSLLSDFEGMPNVVIEAMAAGKPVVATDVGNTRELLATGAGIIVERKEVAYVAEIFESIIRDVEKRRVMGNAGREVIRQKFSLDHSLFKLTQYYSAVLKS